MTHGEDIAPLIAELGDAAAELKGGALEAEQAVALVERCAELATRIAAAVDERASGLEAEVPPDQERLL